MIIQGTQAILNQLDLIEKAVLDAIARGVQKTATAMLSDLKERTAADFQSVPSYLLYAKIHKDLGAKEYPPGTVATFSKGSPNTARRKLVSKEFTLFGTTVTKVANLVPGGRDDLPIQRFPKGTHHLHDDLDIQDATIQGSEVTAKVGYPEDAPPYVSWVLFGTRRHTNKYGVVNPGMVARPFLKDALRDHSQALVENVREEIKAVIREK